MVGDEHESGYRAALKITAVLPDKAGADETQRRKLAEDIVKMLRSQGFICELTPPGDDRKESEH